MGPKAYKAFKRANQNKFRNDDKVIATVAGVVKKGIVTWTRYDLKTISFFANVKLEDNSEEFFWFDEMVLDT